MRNSKNTDQNQVAIHSSIENILNARPNANFSGPTTTRRKMPFLNLSLNISMPDLKSSSTSSSKSRSSTLSSLILLNNAKSNDDFQIESDNSSKNNYIRNRFSLAYVSKNKRHHCSGNDAYSAVPAEAVCTDVDAEHDGEDVITREYLHNCSKSETCNHCQKLMQNIQLPEINSRSRSRSNQNSCNGHKIKMQDKKFIMTLTAKDRLNLNTLMRWTAFALIFAAVTQMIKADDRVGIQSSNWERPTGMPKIKHLEVMCGSQHMEVHLAFDTPFQGLVTSKGMYGQGDCVYVPPRTGKDQFVFNIYYDKCGTKPDNHGKFYENTVVVQYDEELIEAWDEAKRLRCEWFNDYEKTATKTSPMVISDLEIVELNFHGDNVDCWMEIQEGKGPWAPPLNGIAPLGSTLTMVIAVKDPSGEFDMRVKDCEASDGQTGRSLALSDPEGCITRPKLIGKFSKIKLDDGRATVLTYAFISAFKFPDMLNVHLRCTVEICRHGCADHCTPLPAKGNLLGQYTENEPVAAQSQNTVSKVRPNHIPESEKSGNTNNLGQMGNEGIPQEKPDIHEEALKNHPNHNHNAGETQILQVNGNLHVPQRFPQYRPIEQPNHNPGEIFSQAPPQMRPPGPPPPHFSGRPQRHPQPHLRPPPPHHSNKLIPPGLLRQRPDIHRFPPPHPGPLPPRFTGTIKHTMGPDNSPPEIGFMNDQQRHHAQMVENMKMKPEPKNDDSPEELAQRSGEPSKEQDSADAKDQSLKKEDEEIDDSDSKASQEKTSREKVETEMLMEAEPLKDESGQSEATTKEDQSLPDGPVASPAFPKGPRHLRLRRSVSGSSDVIGVQGAFKVVSQADLNFAMNTNVTNSSPTIVLRGRMSSGDPIYGICLPRVGFGVVFFGLGLATLVAILIAAFLAYAHYTVQHYKGQLSGAGSGEGMQSLPQMPMPLPYQIFPMVILKKMW